MANMNEVLELRISHLAWRVPTQYVRYLFVRCCLTHDDDRKLLRYSQHIHCSEETNRLLNHKFS